MLNILRLSQFQQQITILLLLAFISISADPDTEALQLQPREEFKLDLPKIAVSVDDITNEFDGVRISFANTPDQVLIGTYNDTYVKNGSRGSEKTLYREPPEKAGVISKFEAKHIMRVNNDFITALDQFDVILQKGAWGRALYLDCYLPRFINGYYFLVAAARCSESSLPRGARVPDDAFDVSMNSPKSDARITRWRTTPDQIIKLRIAGKELAKQLKHWQKCLDRVKDNEDADSLNELDEALVIFIKVYFNLKPTSTVVIKKSRY